MSKIESMAESQKQDREAELARNLRKADFDQVMAKVSADMEVLESQTSPDVQKQQEHALDMKYLRDRQAQLGFFFGGGVLPLALDHSGLGRLICSLFLALDHSGLGSWAVGQFAVCFNTMGPFGHQGRGSSMWTTGWQSTVTCDRPMRLLKEPSRTF